MGKKPVFIRIALSLVLILFMFSGISIAGVTDINGHWAQVQIEKWINSGLIQGYEDGSFQPDQEITRAEFVTLVNRAFKKENKDAQCNFTDVNPTYWYYVAIASAKEAGYISGDPEGTFRPNASISREEAASIVSRLLNLSTSNQDGADGFADVSDIPAWAKPSIAAVAAKGIMTGYPDGTFRAENPITRAEAVVTLNRVLAIPVLAEGIRGTVKINGQSVEGASVKLFKKDGYEVVKETTSDKDGNYQFAIGEGIYDLTARTAEGNLGNASDIQVDKDNAVTQELTLTKGVNISGTLRDQSGVPFANAKVILTTNPTFLTTADAQGKFSIVVLPDRKYTVRSFIPGRESEGIKEIARDIAVGQTEKELGSLRASFTIARNAIGGGGGSAGGGGAQPGPENHPPVIDLVDYRTTSLYPGDELAFIAHVYDADGDQLAVTWSSDGGVLSQTSGLTTTWTAPETTGNYSIALTVNDGRGGSANYEVKVEVALPFAQGDTDLTLDPGGDEDGDGLSNEEEENIGTDRFQADSDADGLNDAEEVALGTDPRNPDTDGDSLWDGAEVASGTDPLKADSLGDGVPDGQRTFTTAKSSDGDFKVSASLTGTGNLALATISQLDNPLLACYGTLVGKPVNISSDAAAFDHARIGIGYAPAQLADMGIDPADLRLYAFDFEQGQFSPLSNQTLDTTGQFVNGDTLYHTTFGLGTTALEDANLSSQNVVIALDMSSEMKALDKAGRYSWKDGLKAIVSEAGIQTQMAIILRSDGLHLWTDFTSDEQLLGYDLDDLRFLDNPMPGDFRALYEAGINMLDSAPDQKGGKVLIIISASYDPTQQAAVLGLATQAKTKGVKVYLVDVSPDQDTEASLREIVNLTGGRYFHVPLASSTTWALQEINGDFRQFGKLIHQPGGFQAQALTVGSSSGLFSVEKNGYSFSNNDISAARNGISGDMKFSSGNCFGMSFSAALAYKGMLPYAVRFTAEDRADLQNQSEAPPSQSTPLDQKLPNGKYFWADLTTVPTQEGNVFYDLLSDPTNVEALGDGYLNKILYTAGGASGPANKDVVRMINYFQYRQSVFRKYRRASGVSLKFESKAGNNLVSQAALDQVKRLIDRGYPVPVAIRFEMRAGKMAWGSHEVFAHQLVAYDYEESFNGDIALSIYDPNWPHGSNSDWDPYSQSNGQNELNRKMFFHKNGNMYSYDYQWVNQKWVTSNMADTTYIEIDFINLEEYLTTANGNPRTITSVGWDDESLPVASLRPELSAQRLTGSGATVTFQGNPPGGDVATDLRVFRDGPQTGIRQIPAQSLTVNQHGNQADIQWTLPDTPAAYRINLINSLHGTFFALGDLTDIGQVDDGFRDVAPTHWAKRSIDYAYGESLMIGYGDGTFRPDQPVTRAETVVLAMRAGGKDSNLDADYDMLSEIDKAKFPDLNNHWAKKYVRVAAAKGWVFGFPDGNFQPDTPETRDRAANTIWAADLGGKAGNNPPDTGYYDNTSIWYKQAVRELKDIMNGFNENGRRLFKPNANLTRAEAAQIIYNLLFIKK